MKIKKIGHCCLVIEIDGKKVLTDPGDYSTDQNKVTGVDLVLITHEHGDHLHIESLKAVLSNNPQAKVVTNSAVGKILSAEGIAYEILEGSTAAEIAGVALEAFDARHEEIFEEMGQVQNTGFFVAGKLFYPGDAFKVPGKPVDVLALPVAGPWCRVRDSIRYALEVKPRVAFPVHDAGLAPGRYGTAHRAPLTVLPKHGIEFVPLKSGEEATFS
ncbi:MAG TPA: MBL fold metallo-hydrolase [Candidatus Paceibacterota bacterium]